MYGQSYLGGGNLSTCEETINPNIGGVAVRFSTRGRLAVFGDILVVTAGQGVLLVSSQ